MSRPQPDRGRGRRRRSAREVSLRALTTYIGQPRARISPLLTQAGRDALPPLEIAFAQELAFGVVRRRRTLDAVLLGLLDRGLPKEPRVLSALRLGAYQLLYTDVPAHAAVHETAGLVQGRWIGLINAVLRRLSAAILEPSAAVEPALRRFELPDGRFLRLPGENWPAPGTPAWIAFRHGLPEFLIGRWCAVHGAEIGEAIAVASSAAPRVFLRRAGRCPSKQALAERLAAEGVLVSPSVEHPEVLVVEPRNDDADAGKSPFRGEAFAEGWFVAQDPTALAAVEAVAVPPGARVLDLCAAPGTKTSWLATAVGPSGRVCAHDPDDERRARIIENVERLGLTNVDIVGALADTGDGPFDAVLADVPCSNTGVLARRVEVRDRLRVDSFARMQELQIELLRAAVANAKRDRGRIVYSTCSLEPEENQDVVDAVVADPGIPGVTLALIGSHLVLPLRGRRDGGFRAVLESRRA